MTLGHLWEGLGNFTKNNIKIEVTKETSVRLMNIIILTEFRRIYVSII